MSDSKDSGVVGGVGALAVGGGVAYAGANQASKGFVDKILKGTVEGAKEDAVKAVEKVDAKVKTAVEAAARKPHPSFLSSEVAEIPKNLPEGVKFEDLQKEAKELGKFSFRGDGARHATVTVSEAIEGTNARIFTIQHAEAAGKPTVTHRLYVENPNAQLISQPETVLSKKGLPKRLAAVEQLGQPVAVQGAVSNARVIEGALALKDAKAEHIAGGKIHKIAIPGKDGASTDHFVAEIRKMVKPAVVENGVETAAAEFKTYKVPMAKLPEGLSFGEGVTSIDITDANKGKLLENNFLNKALQTAEQGAVKGTRTGLEKGFAMKNMGATRMGLVAAGAVASAFVAKVAFDAMFGQRKDNGYAAKIDAERSAPAVTSPAV